LTRNGRVGISGLGLAAVAIVVLLASGCGYGGVETASSHADLTNGQKLFMTKGCGGCHTLQAAGSQGVVGPNLDNAFAGVRIEGFSTQDIENVVLDQIRLGSGPVATYTNPEKGITGLKAQTPMPANLATGQDALDIAAYVASAVSNKYTHPVDLTTLTTGADIFKLGPCGGCHTLAAAGTHGKVGPPLDGYKPPLTYAIVMKQVENGGGGMPAFQGVLTPAQIQAVAKYVSSVAK
jgi:mono/diheme cytochrome c family protein